MYYYHPARERRTEVHRDDFTTVGNFEDIKWLHASAAKEWQVVERGVLGPPGFTKGQSTGQSVESRHHLVE